MTRARLALGIAAVVLVGLVAGAWVLLKGPDGPDGSPTVWSSLRVRGDVLTVTYGGSACQESNALVVEENEDRVEVTVYAKNKPVVCIHILAEYELEAVLDEPLGEREVFDGACLRAGAPEAACLHSPGAVPPDAEGIVLQGPAALEPLVEQAGVDVVEEAADDHGVGDERVAAH